MPLPIPKYHKIKIHPEHFSYVVSGLKTAEVRFNDRDYKEYDVILMEEFDPKTEKYTGRCARVVVSHVLSGYGLKKKFVCISFKVINTFLA